MKRYISFLIIISSLLSLTGCGGIHTNFREIQQLLVIQTMGLDREEVLALCARLYDQEV